MITTNLQIIGNATIIVFTVSVVIAYSKFRDWYNVMKQDHIMNVVV